MCLQDYGDHALKPQRIGGGKFSDAKPKTDIEWTIYRGAQMPAPGEYHSDMNTIEGRCKRVETNHRYDPKDYSLKALKQRLPGFKTRPFQMVEPVCTDCHQKRKCAPSLTFPRSKVGQQIRQRPATSARHNSSRPPSARVEDHPSARSASAPPNRPRSRQQLPASARVPRRSQTPQV